MIKKAYSFVKQGFSPFIARLIVRSVPFMILLFLANRWGIKTRNGQTPVFPFLKRRKHTNFQILVYHRVNDEEDFLFDRVPIRVFVRQMEILHKHFNVRPLEELLERAVKGDLPPPNPLAITLDDGYRDNFKNAFPILKQFGLPATIFLATGAMDSKKPLWHDRVFDAFRQTNVKSVVLRGREYPLKTFSEKRVAMNTFLQDLRKLDPRDRDDRIQKMTSDLKLTETFNATDQMLNWREIQEMARENISFGAHTVTHPILTRIPLAEAVDEIMKSKEAIERELRSAVRLFAYPNGGREDFNESMKAALKEAGFLGAVTTLWGSNDIHGDPFELRRIGLWDLDPRISVLRLGWYKLFS
jgi:peptidoglycan/xylan/chitin deacetylase (PgdA/CDA1 family)